MKFDTAAQEKNDSELSALTSIWCHEIILPKLKKNAKENPCYITLNNYAYALADMEHARRRNRLSHFCSYRHSYRVAKRTGKQYPARYHVLSILGNHYMLRASYTEAIDAYCQALDIAYSDELTYNLSIAYMLTERYKEAAVCLDVLISKVAGENVYEICESAKKMLLSSWSPPLHLSLYLCLRYEDVQKADRFFSETFYRPVIPSEASGNQRWGDVLPGGNMAYLIQGMYEDYSRTMGSLSYIDEYAYAYLTLKSVVPTNHQLDELILLTKKIAIELFGVIRFNVKCLRWSIRKFRNSIMFPGLDPILFKECHYINCPIHDTRCQ